MTGCGISVSSDAPRVRVQLQLESKDGQPREVVRKHTVKGNEVVEVASFKFVRIGKPAAAPACPEDPRSPSEAILAKATAAEAPSGKPGEPHAVEPTAQQAGTPVGDPSYRSPSFRDGALAGEAPSPPPSTARVGEQQQQQEEEEFEHEMPGEEKEEEKEKRSMPRERDLNAEVASLLSFIPAECPAAVGVTWILTEALRLAVNPNDQEGQAAAATVLQGFQRGLDQQAAAARRLLQGGPEQVREFDKVPAMVRELCAGEPLVASMRQQLAALEQEEAAWRSLEERYRESASASSSLGLGPHAGGAARMVPASPIGGAAAANVVQAADLDALSAAQQRADLQLEFQVQCVDSMLDKAERLVEQAQQACMILQADYHKENFASYAHVNSPQVLVKILSQAAPPAAVECIAASQPSQA